ncbi:peroxiredoxin [Bosea sp. PAMC 26642]|nr:peroxiredoxin [Bosea sp. PAMC 26642]
MPLSKFRNSGLDHRERDATISQGEARPDSVRTLRCRTVAQGRLSQLNYIRILPPQLVKEHEASSQLEEVNAPNASEALLAALGSCLATGIHANAIAQSIPIRSLEVNLAGDINPNAVWGTGDLNPKPIGFQAIEVSVRLDADAPRKVLDALIKHVVLWSPVANTLHNPVHLDVKLLPDATGPSDRS